VTLAKSLERGPEVAAENGPGKFDCTLGFIFLGDGFQFKFISK
jgi:hypothetical protein